MLVSTVWCSAAECRSTPAILNPNSEPALLQAAAVCDQPFQPNSAAKYCFSNKDECKQQFDQLSGAEKQALGMLKYPPALDRWGRQAFDYTDDVS